MPDVQSCKVPAPSANSAAYGDNAHPEDQGTQCVTFIPNNVLITLLTHALGTRGADSAAQKSRQAVGANPEAQHDTHAMSTERLHQQGPWLPEVLRPTKPPVVCTHIGTGRRAGF